MCIRDSLVAFHAVAPLHHIPAVHAVFQYGSHGHRAPQGLSLIHISTVCASYYRCSAGAVLEDGTYPIGTPVKGSSIRILDADGNEVPAGETGEICICGAGVSLGYIGDHEEENRAFEQTPAGERMYRSGDLGYLLPDGNIAFLHRKDCLLYTSRCV